MENGIVDVTGIETPRFAYRLNVTDKDGKVTTVEKRIDMDWVMIQLRQNLPTAFNPTGELGEDGEPLAGLQVTFQKFKDGEEIPAHLPQVSHILHAFKTAMGLPEDAGVKITIALMNAFMEEVTNRGILKKGIPGSPS